MNNHRGWTKNMKTRRLLSVSILLAALLTLVPGTVFAVGLEFDSQLFHFNNADFLDYNHDTYRENQPVRLENTDDRMTFMVSTLRLKYDTKYRNSEFFINMYRSGFWGSDNMEGRDEGKNPLGFAELYFIYYPLPGISVHFGRHSFQVGDALREYFLSDTIDGTQIKWEIMPDMKLTVMGDVTGIADTPSDTYAWFGYAKDEQEMDDYDGDVISGRVGVVFDYWFAKVFSFYHRYGANTEGGADVSENGKNYVNQADGDYLSMNGLRLHHDFGDFGKGDITFAYSYGKDYQYADTRTYNGYAIAANYKYELPIDYFESVQLSTGYFAPEFAGMKAQSMSGTLLMGYLGYFASPYTYHYHFKDYAKDEYAPGKIDRTVSKTFGRIDFGFNVFEVNIDWMVSVLFANEKEEMKYMGTENELNISYDLEEMLQVSMFASVYLPSEYYKEKSQPDKIEDRNTNLQRGTDPFYGMGFKVLYRIDFFK